MTQYLFIGIQQQILFVEATKDGSGIHEEFKGSDPNDLSERFYEQTRCAPNNQGSEFTRIVDLNKKIGEALVVVAPGVAINPLMIKQVLPATVSGVAGSEVTFKLTEMELFVELPPDIVLGALKKEGYLSGPCNDGLVYLASPKDRDMNATSVRAMSKSGSDIKLEK